MTSIYISQNWIRHSLSVFKFLLISQNHFVVGCLLIHVNAVGWNKTYRSITVISRQILSGWSELFSCRIYMYSIRETFPLGLCDILHHISDTNTVLVPTQGLDRLLVVQWHWSESTAELFSLGLNGPVSWALRNRGLNVHLQWSIIRGHAILLA